MRLLLTAALEGRELRFANPKEAKERTVHDANRVLAAEAKRQRKREERLRGQG